MTATTKTPLGAATLVRKWFLDVNTGTESSPVWLAVNGISDFKPTVNPTVQDTSDFDSEGAKGNTVTAYEWSVDLKVGRKTTAALATAYDPGQEVLRLASLEIGLANRVQVRFYEMSDDGPRVEAFSGWCAVSWTPDGGKMDATDGVSVKLSGDGKRTGITHPDTGTVVPKTYAALPAGGPAAGGTLVKITGTGFFKEGVNDVVASTGVKFGTIAATTWTVESDSVIYAVAPAVTAGTVAVKVTNSVGASVTMANYVYS